MFNSKSEFAKELIEGRRFRYKDTEIFYDESFVQPFRCKHIDASDIYSEHLNSYWSKHKSRHLKRVSTFNTKTVYEWIVKNTDTNGWVVLDRLMTEDELAKEAVPSDEYQKTGRSFEIKI
jgi:DNA-binding GntR family transcriptional regulator